MKQGFVPYLVALLCCFTIFSFHKKPASLQARSSSAPAAKGLFDSDAVLQIKLKGKLRELLNDRESPDPKNFPLTLSYISEDSSVTEMPVEVRTRGHFRRMKDNCSYPPLLIRFPEQGPHLNTIFKEQNKLKLVMPCTDDDYIVREWLAYKLYHLITPKSFKVRLVKVQLDDERNKKPAAALYGILLEEEKQMAKRNNAIDIERKMLPQQTETGSFLTMSVFQYLVGNTDWSVEFQQNIKLIAVDSNSVPMAIAYDFDHAGIVNAPYANPAEELKLSSVKERRYRGFCIKDLSVFEPVFAEFNRLKNDIYKLYTDCRLLDEKDIKSTVRYLDEFYSTINNTKAWQRDFAYPCNKNGTGNVIIKGLKEE